MKMRHWTITSSAIALAVTATPALSQTASNVKPDRDPAATPQASGADVGTSDVADIVVTANKREQRLNDVGLTVAVLGGQDLQSRQINNLQDLALTVPSLSFSLTQSGTPVYTLRGVGFNDTSLAAYPTVSVYMDEAPLPFSTLSKHSAFDLERVEVLKGPQGTLFGQNSTGGAINYIAAKPTDKLEGGINLTYGRFNQLIGEGYISGPLSDTLKARFAGRVELMDGWQVSSSRPKGPDGSNGKQRNYMGRLIVDWTPADTIRLNLNLNAWKDRSDTQAGQYSGLKVQNPGFGDPVVLATPFAEEKPRAADWTPGTPYANNRFIQATLRGDIDLTDRITLTSLTSYVNYRQRQGQDTDGSYLNGNDFPVDDGSIKSFSQELRLSNGASGPFRWVVGGNLEHSNVGEELAFDYLHNSTTRSVFAFSGYTIQTALIPTSWKMRNYAGFANAEYDLAPTVTVKAGGRYTDSTTNYRGCNSTISGDALDTGPFIYDVVLGGAFGPYHAGDCEAVNNFTFPIGGVAPGAPGEFRDTLHEHNFSWKVGLDYKPRPGLLLYANVSKGYKAGGFPIIGGSIFEEYQAVTQESVMAYEAGFKASLLDRTLQLNGAGFYYDYTDKQVRAKLQTQLYGILDDVQNIPRSTIKGFELEANIRPTRGLVVNAAFTYVDATIDKYSGINGGGVIANFDGSRMPFTPKYQIGLNVDYDFPVSQALEGFVGGGLNYRSDTTSVVGGDINPPGSTPVGRTLYKIDDYALVDARIGVKGMDDKWRISFFGKNIFNKYYWTNVTQSIDVIIRYAGMPATYGVNLQYKF